MLANSVTRLTRKMQHNHGRLSPPEQAQLDLQLRLLDTHMAQLHHNQPVTATDLFAPPHFLYHTTNTAPHQHQHHLPLQQRHHLQHHYHQPRRPQPFPLHDDEEDKARSVADTSSTPSSPNAAGPAEEEGAPKAAANVGLGRRRTKRLFQDRACQDCETRFTSQWRTGPAGPSTYLIIAFWLPYFFLRLHPLDG